MEKETEKEMAIYIHSHILCTDNTIKDLDMNVTKFSFDYTKYIADDGDLYFIEEIKDGKTMRFITTENQFYNRELKLGIISDDEYLRRVQKKLGTDDISECMSSVDKNQDPPTKKIGVFHSLNTYILMPFVFVTYIISFIQDVAWVLSDIQYNLSISVIPGFLTSSLTILAAVFAFIALINKDKRAVFLEILFLIMHLLDYTVGSIRSVMLANGESYAVVGSLIGIFVYLMLSFLAARYYINRQQLFDDERHDLQCSYITHIFIVYFNICMSGLFIAIYGISIFCMFKESVGYGFFGISIPLFSQAQFLFHSGFNTQYAYLFYTAMAFMAATAAILPFDDPEL